MENIEVGPQILSKVLRAAQARAAAARSQKDKLIRLYISVSLCTLTFLRRSDN